MYYKLNPAHNFKPKTPQNIAAVDRVSEYLADGKSASEDELRGILAGISNPHGDVIKWLARKSRKVLVPATGVSGNANAPRGVVTAIPRGANTNTLALSGLQLWSNPHEVDLSKPFIYRIEIYTKSLGCLDYIGKARSASRLQEYDRNMAKIDLGRERGKAQKYRAVHFALYQAVKSSAKYVFYPLENCNALNLNDRERQYISAYPCRLNNGRGWRVSELQSLTIEMLLTC